MAKTKILIIGAGFGGIYTFLNLKKHIDSHNLDIAIINKNNYFLFTPMLHEVATGGLNLQNVVEAIREIINSSKAKFFKDEITEVDLVNKVAKSKDKSYEYDYLVVSTGATTNYYNIEGAKEYSIPLKDLQDSFKMRAKIIESLEQASKITDQIERKKYLNFVVVGAGPTGVELVCEVQEFLMETLKHHYSKVFNKDNINIYLINKSSDILNQFNPKVRDKAKRVLAGKNIELILDCAITKVTEDTIYHDKNEELKTVNVFWTAGVTPNQIKYSPEIAVEANRIVVDEYLQSPNTSNTFFVGDIAGFKDKKGQVVPMLAQVAVKEAHTVSKNILKGINGQKPIKYKPSITGLLISLGQWDAVGTIKGITISGPWVWWLWRTIYLFKFASWQKRIRIAFDWTLNLFYPRDICKI